MALLVIACLFFIGSVAMAFALGRAMRLETETREYADDDEDDEDDEDSGVFAITAPAHVKVLYATPVQREPIFERIPNAEYNDKIRIRATFKGDTYVSSNGILWYHEPEMQGVLHYDYELNSFLNNQFDSFEMREAAANIK